MLNYVSIIKVEIIRKTVPKEIHYFRSPLVIKEKDAINWIENELKKYPNAVINQYHASSYGTNIYTTTIGFDPKKTNNLNDFLKKCGIPIS